MKANPMPSNPVSADIVELVTAVIYAPTVEGAALIIQEAIQEQVAALQSQVLALREALEQCIDEMRPVRHPKTLEMVKTALQVECEQALAATDNGGTVDGA